MKELKHLPIQFDAKAIGSDGSFEGYASTFNNVDQGYDVVLPGAFKKTLKERPADQIKMLWQHNPWEPIGFFTEAKEDTKGLFVKGTILSGVQRGAEAIALMKAGVIDSMSIGYRTLESEFTNAGVRQLKEVGLYEVSLVTFPMNQEATVTRVKEFNPRELEKALRDEAGLSGRDAVKAVAVLKKRLSESGVNVEIDPREAEATTQEALNAVFAEQARRLLA